MMSKFKKDFLELNTTPLLTELNEVLNKGVKNILSDILKRHELLEQTHQAILNLPNIKGYIKKENDLDFDELDDIVFDVEEDEEETKFEENFDHNVSHINNLTRDEFINYQKSTNDIIDKLVSQIDSLKNEIKDLELVVNNDFGKVWDYNNFKEKYNNLPVRTKSQFSKDFKLI